MAKLADIADHMVMLGGGQDADPLKAQLLGQIAAPVDAGLRVLIGGRDDEVGGGKADLGAVGDAARLTAGHRVMFKKVLKYNNYKEQDFNLSNYINYKLNPPLVLQLQSDEAQITIVQNIVNALDGLKLPSDPRKILQRYIPNINWDTIYKEGQNYKQELGKQAIIAPDNQQGY